MKTLFSIICIALISAACNSKTAKTVQQTDSDNPVKIGKGKYALKSGIVEYKTKMMGIEATQTTYFDDYGAKEAYEVQMEMMGVKMNSVTIIKDGMVYNFDPEKKTGTKTSLTNKKENIDFENLTEEIQKEMNITKVGEEDCNGKPCIKYSIDNSSLSMKGFYWVWKGIPMKTDLQMSKAKMVMDAVKVVENATVPAGKFEIPADIKFGE